MTPGTRVRLTKAAVAAERTHYMFHKGMVDSEVQQFTSHLGTSNPFVWVLWDDGSREEWRVDYLEAIA